MWFEFIRYQRFTARLSLLTVFFAFFGGGAAFACPASVARIHTKSLGGVSLCEVIDRYESVRGRLIALGKDPLRIANATAPRFIDAEHWLRVAAEKNYNPWFVYDPAPMTWEKWENSRALLDLRASENRRRQKPALLSVQFLLKLHTQQMFGLLKETGIFRKVDDIGLAVQRKKALTRSDLEVLRMNANAGAGAIPSVGWVQTGCYEDIDPSLSKEKPTLDELMIATFPLEPKSFLDANGVEKECGYLTYPEKEHVPALFRRWLMDLNSRTLRMSRGESIDPFITVARAQKRFIAIHPFEDGNGRMSRFVVDYLLQSLGLPPPLLTDFDRDLFTTEEEWAEAIGKGVLRALETLESCALDHGRPGCQTVSEKPSMALR